MKGNAEIRANVPFAPGDEVRLTRRYAKTLSKKRTTTKVYKCTTTKVNWDKRRGIVHSCNPYTVSVFWEGRRSADVLLVNAVEKIARGISNVVPSGSAPVWLDQ